MQTSSDHSFELAQSCSHSWCVTPFGKQFWVPSTFRVAHSELVKVCLKCRRIEIIPVHVEDVPGFVPCPQCKFDECLKNCQCQHQTDGFTKLLDFIERANNSKEV